jgi:hypothetical protein
MKAKLIFDVPEERKEFLAAVRASDVVSVLWTITYNVGKSMENHYEGMPDEEYEKLRPMDAVTLFRERISDALVDAGINIDDLIE